MIATGLYGLNIVDLSLLYNKNLILADLHLGYEELLNLQGVMIPKFQYKKITERIEKILSIHSPENIIINGDLKHEFGRISKQEWDETLNFIDFLGKRFKKIILVKGNHDTLTEKILKKKKIKVCENYIIKEILITHGHKIPEISKTQMDKIETIVIGHDHPCVGIIENTRVEKVKCFLSGKWKNKNLIVMPSFNFISEGTNILQENLLSPMLQDISKFKVYGVENFEVFPFGKVEDLQISQNKENTF